MSEKKKESITESKINRRSMLKWTGALAGAAAVGAVAEYGASELMKPVTPPPPPPVSFKPPLSPEIQQRVDAIKQQLVERHTGEQIFYTTDSANGCGCTCIFRARVKNGVITAFEVDDTINQGALREDAAIDSDALMKEMIQIRGCARAFGRRMNIYAPTRLLYPLKRVGERGERKWVRITWDEAIDTIAAKINQLKEKYGPNFAGGPTYANINGLGGWGGFGFMAYQSSSFSGTEFSEKSMLGGNPPPTGTPWGSLTNDVNDLFNTKLVVSVGWNAAVTYTDASYWLTLLKERGVPMIWIEPTFSVSANCHANQWIPIRPGTDAAMLLAIANVLFKEDLYDKDYVSKFVEPTGFLKWKDYVLGNTPGEDGKVDRTPEWQESITGVPAETVRALARLYGKSKPAYFRVHWSAARQLETDATASVGIALAAMTGNIGAHGGWHNGTGISMPSYVPSPFISWGTKPKTYAPSTMSYVRGWMDAVLLRDKLESGEISDAEYRQRIGVAQGVPLPNPQMQWMSSGEWCGGGAHDVNKQIRAMKKMEFILAHYFHMNQGWPAAHMADIVLPEAELYWEVERTGFSGPSSFLGEGNFFLLPLKIINPPGEARSVFWAQVQIANRLGFADQWVPPLKDVPYEKFDDTIRAYLKTAYETWAKRPDIAPKNPPSWDEFTTKPVYRVPLEREPFVEYRKKIVEGEPFRTSSGKIEIYSDFIASGDVAVKGLPFTKQFLGVDDHCFGGSQPPRIPPMPQWHLQRNSVIGPQTKIYPLMVLTSHSHYRQHSSQDNNPWFFPDECRHACWLSVPDAKSRGIKDGDLVRVHNDLAEMVLPAYVTSRLTPGTCRVGFGAWYVPSDTKTSLMPLGIDRRGLANFLTPSDHYPWIMGPVVSTNLVEVDKF